MRSIAVKSFAANIPVTGAAPSRIDRQSPSTPDIWTTPSGGSQRRINGSRPASRTTALEAVESSPIGAVEFGRSYKSHPAMTPIDEVPAGELPATAFVDRDRIGPRRVGGDEDGGHLAVDPSAYIFGMAEVREEADAAYPILEQQRHRLTLAVGVPVRGAEHRRVTETRYFSFHEGRHLGQKWVLQIVGDDADDR